MVPHVSIKPFTLLLILGASWLSLQAAEESPRKSTVEIEYSSAVYDFSAEQKKVILQGPITIRTSTLLVTCDTAEVLSSRKENGDTSGTDSSIGSIDYILAKGNVEITQAGSKALAGRAEIFPSEHKLILEENPRIVDQYGTVSGYRIVFLQGERRIKIESGEEQQRSHISLNNVEEIGFLMGEEEESTDQND